jgi:hypothetical protein
LGGLRESIPIFILRRIDMQMQAQGSLMNRLMGVVTFKAPVYKEIAEDKSATQTAALIVVVVAVVVGVIGGIVGGSRSFIGNLISTIVIQLLVWAISSWVLAFVAKTFFQGDTDTGEMLRVTGHTSVFNLLGIIPFLGIIGGILQAVANVIGIREAAGFDTTKAILTAVIAWVVGFIITMIITAIFAAIFIGAAVVSGAAQ